MSEHSLSAALVFVAEDLEQRLYPFAGVIRRAARELAELEGRSTSPTACPVCGEDVEQPAKGRARVYCSAKCRGRARNARLMVR
jgi:hypothetical protein